MPIVRNKFGFTPDYIIDYIRGTYHINITYNKACDARTKALTKIFEN